MNFTVQLRDNSGKGFNRRLRKEGISPGIVYGKDEPKMISMRSDQALRFIKSMKGAKRAFELNLESDGETKSKTVILQDYQLSNWGKKLLHIDFLEVSSDTKLTVDVPIRIINEDICPAVKTGGVLQTIRRSVPVRCAVKDIPEEIIIDVKDLEFDSSVHVLDLICPEGVEPVVINRNFTVVTVAGRMVEEVEEVEEIDEIEEGEVPVEEGKEGVKDDESSD